MRIFVFYAHSSIFYVEMKIKFKNYKNLVDLFKGRVWANPTNTFRLCNLTIAEQLTVWRLEHNGVNL